MGKRREKQKYSFFLAYRTFVVWIRWFVNYNRRWQEKNVSKSIPRQEERSLSIWKGVEFLHREEIEPYRVNERLIGTSSNSNVLLLLLSGRITSFVRTSLSSFIFGSWGWVDGGRRSRFQLGSLGNIRTRQESRSKRIKIYFAQTDRSAAASPSHT